MYNLSDARVANTDFIRCRSISFAYEFRQPWLERFFIQRMQVKASMTNPFLWVSDKKWDGLDPETGNCRHDELYHYPYKFLFKN